MPLHDVGYRAWRGAAAGGPSGGAPGGAAWVIASTGIRLAFKSAWLRRVLFFAWSPALVFAGGFFAFEQAVEDAARGTLGGRSHRVAGFDIVEMIVADAPGGLLDEPATARRTVWSRLLLSFMRAPQAVLLAIVVGLVAPKLIAGDLRAKAWLVYFTRPLRRRDYILGKSLTLAAIVSLITLVPAVVLWALGVLVSPSITVAWATADLPLRIIAAAAAVTIPTVLLALAYSSLTAESRIATFAWFATWVACWIAHGALTGADMAARAARPTEQLDLDQLLGEAAGDPRFSRGRPTPGWLARAAGLETSVDRWAWLSLYHAQGVVQAWIFGIERRPGVVIPPLATLLAVAGVSLVILGHRVDAPARA